MQPRAGTPTGQMVPAARERRPPVGTAARRAAGGSLLSAFTGCRHGAHSARTVSATPRYGSRRTLGFPPRRDRLGIGGPSRRPPSAGCADRRSAFPSGRHHLAPSAFRVCASSCPAGWAGGPIMGVSPGVGVQTGTPPVAGRDGVLPSSGMAHVSCAYPTGQSGTPARERRPLGSSPGGARHRTGC